MTSTNQAIINEAFSNLGVVADGRAPSPTQAATAVTVLNDNIASQMKEGWGSIGWWPQTVAMLANNAPLQDADIGPIKLCLTSWLAPKFAVKIPPPTDPGDETSLAGQIRLAFRQMNKRYLKRTECDLGELSRPQGGPWGGPNYFG